MDILPHLVKTFISKCHFAGTLIVLTSLSIHAQQASGTYVSGQLTLSAPMSSFASASNVNVVRTLTHLISPVSGTANGGLLLPAVTGFGISGKGNYDFYKGFGVALQLQYQSYGSDASAASRTTDEALNLLSGPLLSSLLGSQLGGAGAALAGSNIRFKAEIENGNYHLFTAYVGPSYQLIQDRWAFGLRASAGIISVTTPDIKASLKLDGGFFSTTLLSASQASVSKAFFSTLFGFDLRYQIASGVGIILTNEYMFTPQQTFTTEIRYEVPAAALLGGNNAFTTPSNFTSTNTVSFQSWNTSLGVFYQFSRMEPKQTSQPGL